MTGPVKNNPWKHEHDAILKKRSNKYYFYIKELKIIGSGTDIQSSYEDLMRKKELTILEFGEAASLNELPPPSSMKHLVDDRVALKDLLFFSLKALIAGIIFFLIMTFTVDAGSRIVAKKFGDLIFNNLEMAIEKVATSAQNKLSPKSILQNLEATMEVLASWEIEPDRQENLAKNIRITLEKIKPMADAIKPIFVEGKEDGSDS